MEANVTLLTMFQSNQVMFLSAWTAFVGPSSNLLLQQGTWLPVLLTGQKFSNEVVSVTRTDVPRPP